MLLVSNFMLLLIMFQVALVLKLVVLLRATLHLHRLVALGLLFLSNSKLCADCRLNLYLSELTNYCKK